jgi:hypothetical protein
MWKARARLLRVIVLVKRKNGPEEETEVLHAAITQAEPDLPI